MYFETWVSCHTTTHMCIFEMQRVSQWVECCVCALHCRGSVFCVVVNPMPLRISLPPSPSRLRWQTVVSSDTDWSWLRLMTSCWCHQRRKCMVMLSVLTDTNIWPIQCIFFRIRRPILPYLTQVTFSWFRSLQTGHYCVCNVDSMYPVCPLSGKGFVDSVVSPQSEEALHASPTLGCRWRQFPWAWPANVA